MNRPSDKTYAVPFHYILLALAVLVEVFVLQSLFTYAYDDSIRSRVWLFDGVYPMLNYAVWAGFCPFIYRFFFSFAENDRTSFARTLRRIGYGLVIAGAHRGVCTFLFFIALVVFTNVIVDADFLGQVLGGYAIGMVESVVVFWIIVWGLNAYRNYKENGVASFKMQQELSNALLSADLWEAPRTNGREVSPGYGVSLADDHGAASHGRIAGPDANGYARRARPGGHGTPARAGADGNGAFQGQAANGTTHAVESAVEYAEAREAAGNGGHAGAHEHEPEQNKQTDHQEQPANGSRLPSIIHTSRFILDSRIGRAIDPGVVTPYFYEPFHSFLSKVQLERHFVIGVTSPNPGDGKTTVAANLAVALAMGYEKKTLLIDLNLRQPRIHQVFDTSLAPGVVEAMDDMLFGRIPISATRIIGLFILPTGKLPAEQNGRVGPGGPHGSGSVTGARSVISLERSAAFFDLLAGLEKKFECIIIDMPPVNTDEFPVILSSRLPHIIAVADARKTRQKDINRMLRQMNGDQMLGFVLNRMQEPPQLGIWGY